MSNSEQKTELETAAQQSQISFDAEEYKKVSCKAQLEAVRLIESKYVVTPDAFAVEPGEMGFGFECHSNDVEFSTENGSVFGMFHWKAEVNLEDKDEPCLALLATYLIHYSGLSECDEDHVKYFFEKVGRFASYPYFRTLFAMNTSASELLLPPLPTLSERVD